MIDQGSVIAQRFEVIATAGSGGMGTVYRARDQINGADVAIKLIGTQRTTSTEVERFIREATVLAELQHPGIVSYVAHGQTIEGWLYLVMEWLEGEDLAMRLSRGPLSIAESLSMLRCVADALSFAHRRGIVHRDLKPGNLFLRGGDLERVTLLDFGIARRHQGSLQRTRTGVLVGTPEYMAPEQARGERNLGPPTDVFALGCVLYECLTGQPPFVADHIAAQLAKVLFEEPLSLRRLRPDAHEALEHLLRRMLHKDTTMRLHDAGAVLTEADTLIELGISRQTAHITTTTVHRLTASEQELVCVVFASPPHVAIPTTHRLQLPNSLDELTVADNYQAELTDELARFGLRAAWLGDGSLVATLSRAGNATDQSAQAARAALELHERWPEAAVSLATGRGVVQGRLPMGEAIDRAARLLSAHTGPASGDIPHSPDGQILVDDVTVAILDNRFTCARSGDGWRLLGERATVDDTRMLLGRPTPCVGREPELGMLEALLVGCREESTSSAVLVKAQQGLGKTRLCQEFLRRLRTRNEEIEIWLGRGDAMNAGASYGILANALCRECGIVGGEPLDSQQEKLQARVGRSLPVADRDRVIEFIGELCGVPFSDSDRPALRAARNDPKVLSREINQAFLDFLRAECRQQPMLLVFDDLQWGDAMSIRLLGNALRELADLPLLVLALGRPEVTSIFPQLWADKIQEISLSALSRKAAERLIEQTLGEVLGRKVPAVTVARLVGQAAGNALYLEELIRSEATGKGELLPASILAMLQSRLSRLEPGARRVLRAASIFGDIFWRGGVRVLLGGDRIADEIDAWLGILNDAEIIERHRDSRVANDHQYAFRHGLLREAAYSLLTADDQALGHLLAGEFLEKLGERDPVVIAEHLQRGGAAERAGLKYLQAAELALAENDLSGALQRAERGIACGASGDLLGSLRAVQALAHFWRGEWGPANHKAREAMTLVPRANFLRTHAMRASFVMLFGRRTTPAVLPIDKS